MGKVFKVTALAASAAVLAGVDASAANILYNNRVTFQNAIANDIVDGRVRSQRIGLDRHP
jgi:hypothetical protein